MNAVPSENSIRKVRTHDYKAISNFLRDVFRPSIFESRLVESLRENRKSVQEWVMETQGDLVAHICYSDAFKGERCIGYHLAPVAVRADARGAGFGSLLIRHSRELVGDGKSPVFVLGDPEYYERIGFRRTLLPRCPFDENNQHFLSLRWASPDSFTIGYEPEFYAEA